MSLEILLMSVKHSPNQLRAYITSETQKVLKYIFFNHIIENTITCKDDTMHLMVQIMVIIVLRSVKGPS
jgi:hypothetical protein